jgi:FtsP/CotA-like multicopper oxidase with cupredoxin domain
MSGFMHFPTPLISVRSAQALKANPNQVSELMQRVMIYQEGGKEFQISAATDAPFLNVSTSQAQLKDRFEVRLSVIPEKLKSGTVKGTLVINTNDNEFPQVTIPVTAIVHMTHPGVWILGDLADDDRRHGMGIVVEYAGRAGKAQWITPPAFKWNYARFAKPGTAAPPPDETFEMTFAKDNAAEEGFNRWTINGVAYPMTSDLTPAAFHLKQGKRYRLRMRNASDDIHPIHLHRHSFELVSIAGKPTSGVIKDMVMLGGYQEAEIDFVADNPGLTLFHCHQQLHMDFGFMTLFDYM